MSDAGVADCLRPAWCYAQQSHAADHEMFVSAQAQQHFASALWCAWLAEHFIIYDNDRVGSQHDSLLDHSQRGRSGARLDEGQPFDHRIGRFVREARFVNCCGMRLKGNTGCRKYLRAPRRARGENQFHGKHNGRSADSKMGAATQPLARRGFSSGVHAVLGHFV